MIRQRTQWIEDEQLHNLKILWKKIAQNTCLLAVSAMAKGMPNARNLPIHLKSQFFFGVGPHAVVPLLFNRNDFYRRLKTSGAIIVLNSR